MLDKRGKVVGFGIVVMVVVTQEGREGGREGGSERGREGRTMKWKTIGKDGIVFINIFTQSKLRLSLAHKY